MHLQAPNQQPDHIFRFVIAIVIVVLLITVSGSLLRLETPPADPPPASIPIEGSAWRLFVNDNTPPAQVVEENGGLFVKITLTIFNDLNLDGMQGDPELGTNQVRLYNVEDYTDTRLYEEEIITDNRVRLCYGLTCKKPNNEGQISFLVPKVTFDVSNTIPITLDYRPGRYAYHAFNQPGTINGTLEGQQIILSPQFYGGGDIELPTNRVFTEFKIGFSDYPCVLPFDESVLDELLPMNFYDFNPGEGAITNFDGEEPSTLQDIDPAFGAYNSRNHAGFDFYYPRMEQIVRYSCLLEPEYLPLSSSPEFGNIVFSLDPEYDSDEFLVGFGHLEAPDVNNFDATGLRFGEAFGTIGDKGSSITHLHYSFGDFAEYRMGGSITFCAVPIFPYIGENLDVKEVAYGNSQLGEEVCFDNLHPTYTVFMQEGDQIFAPFVPSMSIGD
ncbi:MAG: hypothetical protein V2J07_01530 [Anaerolineae bacterium]|jgi:hypothetical protein|nr:hypothetical protein [Anaerolineae bacterium]